MKKIGLCVCNIDAPFFSLIVGKKYIENNILINLISPNLVILVNIKKRQMLRHFSCVIQ